MASCDQRVEKDILPSLSETRRIVSHWNQRMKSHERMMPLESWCEKVDHEQVGESKRPWRIQRHRLQAQPCRVFSKPVRALRGANALPLARSSTKHQEHRLETNIASKPDGPDHLDIMQLHIISKLATANRFLVGGSTYRFCVHQYSFKVI